MLRTFRLARRPAPRAGAEYAAFEIGLLTALVVVAVAALT